MELEEARGTEAVIIMRHLLQKMALRVPAPTGRSSAEEGPPMHSIKTTGITNLEPYFSDIEIVHAPRCSDSRPRSTISSLLDVWFLAPAKGV